MIDNLSQLVVTWIWKKLEGLKFLDSLSAILTNLFMEAIKSYNESISVYNVLPVDQFLIWNQTSPILLTLELFPMNQVLIVDKPMKDRDISKS